MELFDTLDSPEYFSNDLGKSVGIRMQVAEKYGLRTKQNTGVILTRVIDTDTEDVYSRVGMFMLNSASIIWFGGTEEKTIKIV